MRQNEMRQHPLSSIIRHLPVLVLVGCTRTHQPVATPATSLPEGQFYAYQLRAAHSDEIMLAVGDSQDVVLLRSTCGVPSGHGMTACYGANNVAMTPRWIPI